MPTPADNPLAALLGRAAALDPDTVAIHARGGRAALTHAGLDALAAGVAGALHRDGVSAGDRVVVQAHSTPTALALHLACVRLGAVHVPIDVGLADPEVAALLADAEPAAVVRPEGRDPLPGPWRTHVLDAEGHGDLPGDAAPFAGAVVRTPDDPAAMLYTSGTTGRPKGVVLTQANLIANARNLVQAWGFGPDDVLLHVLPLSHTHGLFVAAYCALASGASMHQLPRFDADEVVALLPRSTVMMGVPTHWTRLLDHPGFDAHATAGMRLLTSGSAPLRAETHDAIRERTGQVVLERYGMTEASIMTSNPLDGQRRPGTVGFALPGVELRVAGDDDAPVPAGEVGQVQVRGATVFHGYWRRPGLKEGECSADGWFRTGDLARLDPDGYLEIVGRAKDLVISGGFNVHPKEVEAVLDGLPGVLESAVVGVPDADLGERVVAAVVAEPGAALDPDALRAAAREALAGYKVPRTITVLAELPRNHMGKVEKSRLRTTLTP